MVLEQIQDSGPTGTASYYHADQLGSIRALTDQAGTVVNTYAYDAYGTTTASTGSVANPFRYAGEYQDAETGLYYLRARYYDPATQQFLTRDPLVAATEQAYNYAGGSPLNATDPSGMNPYGCLGLFGTGCLERLRANSCYYFDLFCTAQEAQENAARRADEAAQHANDGLQWACAQGVASACAEVGRQLGNVLCSIVPSWQPPNPGGVPGARPATASELRQWAQSQGYRQRPGTGTPQGGPETWEDPVTGEWKLKLKEPSTQPGLASGSNVDRYSAKDAAGNYYDPITGVSGTRSQLGHLPLIWK
jgi:RHS repeat-associated protein